MALVRLPGQRAALKVALNTQVILSSGPGDEAAGQRYSLEAARYPVSGKITTGLFENEKNEPDIFTPLLF